MANSGAILFEVVVGNIGVVWTGNSHSEAEAHYQDYCQSSKLLHGRVAGESVTLLRDDEIIQEMEGSNMVQPEVITEAREEATPADFTLGLSSPQKLAIGQLWRSTGQLRSIQRVIVGWYGSRSVVLRHEESGDCMTLDKQELWKYWVFEGVQETTK